MSRVSASHTGFEALQAADEGGGGAGVQERRRAGRFRERRGLVVMRSVAGIASRVLPRVAARGAFSLLSRPPRCKERPWQAKLREAARMSTVQSGKHVIAVYEWGAGPTVLMVHGWGARATHMGKFIMPLIQAGFRVVAFDAPAHGQSTGRRTDLVEFASSIYRVAETVGEPHAILAHSFGSAMALYALRDWPLATKRLVLVSAFEHCSWFTQAFGKYLGITPGVVSRMQQLLANRYDGRFNWGSMSTADMLRHAGVPTLLIHDELDEEIPFQHSVGIHQAARDVELLATRGLGHHRLLGDPAVIHSVVNFVLRK